MGSLDPLCLFFASSCLNRRLSFGLRSWAVWIPCASSLHPRVSIVAFLLVFAHGQFGSLVPLLCILVSQSSPFFWSSLMGSLDPLCLFFASSCLNRRLSFASSAAFFLSTSCCSELKCFILSSNLYRASSRDLLKSRTRCSL